MIDIRRTGKGQPPAQQYYRGRVLTREAEKIAAEQAVRSHLTKDQG